MTKTKPPTVEEYLLEWAKQAPHVCFVTDAERFFIEAMRKARKDGVGFGWMQDIIEVEWNATVPEGGWGPKWYEKRKDDLFRIIEGVVFNAQLAEDAKGVYDSLEPLRQLLAKEKSK